MAKMKFKTGFNFDTGRPLVIRDLEQILDPETDMGKAFSEAIAFYVEGAVLQAYGIIPGNGDPEGVVTAGVSTLFLRQDGGIGTSLYIKQVGSGNTGWYPVGGYGQ